MSFETTGKTPMRAAFALFLLAAVVVPGAHADWPRDPYTGNVPICTQPNYQESMRSLPDGAGGAFLVWHDYRSGVNFDLYMQHLGADGTPLWAADGVPLCTAANSQLNANLTSDGAGGFIVAWEDGRNTGGYDIYAQRVNADGVPQWASDGVPLCTVPVGQFDPKAISDGAGGAMVVWRDNRIPGNADLFAQRVDAFGVVQWTANGVGVCNAIGSLSLSQPVSDGAGGFIVAWEDYRSGNADVYAQRVSAAGVPQWTTDGVVVCSMVDTQGGPRAIPDGEGGIIVTWYDWRTGLANGDVYAQRMNAAGAPLWPANGVAVGAATGSQSLPVIGSDGLGGAIIAWWDQRGTDIDTYAQRVTANGAGVWAMNGIPVGSGQGNQCPRAVLEDGIGGVLVAWDDTRSGLATDVYAQRLDRNGAARWTANGVVVCAAVGGQNNIFLATDGAGGAIATWTDQRYGITGDVFAQRVDRYGQLGNAEPRITSVRDVPNDQGGSMKLSFAASYLDEDGFNPDLEYTVWRSVPDTWLPGLQSTRGVTADPDEARASGKLLVLEGGASGYAWELVGEMAAFGLPSYSFVVSTTGDSLPGSNPLTAVMVMVHKVGIGAGTWASAPDSGHSVDNLPPAAPVAFSALQADGATHLGWQPSPEADFAAYRLYRGNTASFQPSPANLVSAQTVVGYTDLTEMHYYYKLTAVDSHGNESGVALAGSGGTTGVEGSEAGGLWLAPPSPNPARGSAMLRWSLPQASPVKLEVFDAAGRRVRSLHDGPLPAGGHAMRFDLTGDGGSTLPSGLYLVRLETASRVLTRRVMAIR